MSGPLGSQQWMYNAGGSFYPYSIDQSLRFDGSSSYLSKNDFGTATDTNIRTFSTWIKQSDLSFSTLDAIIGCATSNIQTLTYYSNNTIGFYNTQGGTAYEDNSAAVFRDIGAWFHIFFTYSHTANEMKLYINGSLTKGFSTGTHGPLEKLAETGHITTLMKRSNASQYVGAYLAETVLLDGYVGDINDFAESKNGVWVPKNISAAGLTYGANGFYLNYADSSDLGKDVSGRGNHFTSNGLAAEDQVPDSPTNNFATLNATFPHVSMTFSEGNLKWSTTVNNRGAMGNFAIPIGTGQKYYFEYVQNGWGNTSGDDAYIGLNVDTVDIDGTRGGYTTSYSYGANAGNKRIAGSETSYGTAWGTGDVIGIAVDRENNTINFAKNNTFHGTFAIPATGNLFAWVGSGGGSGNANGVFNFGQDSSFAGTKSSGSSNATDNNGIGDFYYAPPSSFLALCTANLPEPAIGPNSDANDTGTTSDEHFDTVLYTGTLSGSGVANITHNGGFTPDFVWTKSRSASSQHILRDSVRGANLALRSEDTAAESDKSGNGDMTSLATSTTFATNYTDGMNESGKTYAAWLWKAGGTASSIAVDEYSTGVPSIASSVSANPDAGFSIVSWSSTNTDNQTIGHGLSATPELIISKSRNTAGTDWWVWAASESGEYGRLNNTGAWVSDTSIWYTAGMSSTTFGVRLLGNNYLSRTYIAYCFHSVDGFSKVGSYRSNNSSDGTFVYTGFRPAWVMIKRDANTTDWQILDTKRNPFNVMNEVLEPNTSLSTRTSTASVDFFADFLSNGFKLRGNGSHANGGTSDDYIYLAFAEAPFKYANAR